VDIQQPAWARTSHVVRGRGLPAPAGGGVERHLVLAWRSGWQSSDDWHTIARHVRDIDPRIEPFVVNGGMPNSYSRRKAAKRPTFVFSSGPLDGFRPLRGRVYQGRQIPKLDQLTRLAAAGVPVPRTAMLTPDLRLDPTAWGKFVIVKPTDLYTSSHGQGIQLMRTERVRFIPPEDYPPDHPGRNGPMIVQQFIDTGEHITLYRVLTLFGEPLYSTCMRGTEVRLDYASASDAEIENAVVATQATTSRKSDFVRQEDVLALARAAHDAIPEVPQKGCDIIRDAATNALYVLEVNPGGNTWHFSSRFLAEARARRPAEHEHRRVRQFDAFRTAARVLVDKTNAEAE
jgi:hypothetical protein